MSPKSKHGGSPQERKVTPRKEAPPEEETQHEPAEEGSQGKGDPKTSEDGEEVWEGEKPTVTSRPDSATSRPSSESGGEEPKGCKGEWNPLSTQLNKDAKGGKPQT